MFGVELPELELSIQEHGRPVAVRFQTGPVVVGRMDECDFVVPDGRASRKHAVLEREGDTWFVRDLGSVNGTYVNGQQLQDRHEVADGDMVQLGGSVVRCRLHGSPAPIPANVVDPIVDPAEDAIVRVSKTVRVGDIGNIVNSVFGPSLETLPVRSGPPVFGSNPSQQAAELTRIVGAAADVLVGSDDLETTQHYILDLVFDNLPVDRGFLLLLDPAGTLVPGAQRTRPGGDAAQARISQLIADTALNSRKAALIEQIDATTGAGVAAAMCAPLCREGRVVGLLYVDRDREQTPFGKLHLDVLSIIASISGAAIESARKGGGSATTTSRLARHVGEAVAGELELGDDRVAPERRECTVVRCEVTGLFVGTATTPADDLAAQTDELLEGLCEAIVAENGTLDRFSGVGLVAFFGAPGDGTDHAARAVRSALAMQRWIRERTAPDNGRALELRIGIESGDLVVGDVGTSTRLEYTAIGEAADAANVLCSAVASEGQVVIGAGTFRLAHERFECEALPPSGLARRSDPGQAWLVRGSLEDDGSTVKIR